MNDKSKLFNYDLINDISFCSNITSINSKKFNNRKNIKKFKLVTQNLLGLNDPEFFLNERIPYIINNILKIDADIYLFQEVSEKIFIELLNDERLKNYYFSNEKFYNNQLQTLIMSKIKPLEMKNYYIGGLSNYMNSFSIIRFNNLIIVNIYVQAGNKDSPYLEKKWKKFRNCRINNIYNIKKFIYQKYNNKCKNIIFTGDVNFDINDKKNVEYKIITKDIFLMKNIIFDKIYSEDTYKNFFRYNIKQIEKQKLYDGIFITGNIITSKPRLINTKPIFYLNKKQTKNFIDKISLKFNKIKIKTLNKKIPIYISDHFGLTTNIIVF